LPLKYAINGFIKQKKLCSSI